MNAIVKDFIRYLESLNTTYITVSDTENAYLYPQFKHIEHTFARANAGVIFTDRQGTYTPIERHYTDILHLMRIPRISNDVYAISDFRSIVYTKVKSLVIVFQGVYETLDSGYDFIDDSFFIRPIPGVSFGRDVSVPHLAPIDKNDTTTAYDKVEYDDEEEYE